MRQEYPLVTIVTITFNLIKADREKTFRQCIESVHNQTYKNIEHIIIDGASKDGTLDLINEYSNKGWIKYISESDNGIYDAMNKGIKLAKGKYIAFLNSDDFYHNNTGVETSIMALEDSNSDFSYAPVKMINPDGSVIDFDHPHCSPNILNVFFVMPFCHQTMFTRKDVLIKEGMFDDNFKSAGDYDLLLRLCLKKYKSIYVRDKFTTFTWGGFSISNNGLSIKEVVHSYYKNYSKICSITKIECEKIYCSNYHNIPLVLADKLRENKEYFNYFEYIKDKKLFNKIISNFIRVIKIIKFAIFFPKQFFKKCLFKFKNKFNPIYKKLPLSIKKIYRYFKSKIYEK